jgi:hypothetical protein
LNHDFKNNGGKIKEILTGGEKLGSGRLNRKGLRVNQDRVSEMM